MLGSCQQQSSPLVILLLLSAQARCAVTSSLTTAASTEPTALGDATKALRAAAAAAAAAAKQILEDAAQRQQPASVVQDWSLVCKELCGARLGVAPCAAHCAALDALPPTPSDHAAVLKPKFRFAKCGILCRLQTVGSVQEEFSATAAAMGDQLCGSFCGQRRSTLAGCSPCQWWNIEDASTRRSIASHGSTSRVADMQTLDADVSADDADAPDWNELCKLLCKSGDGGSLCNCNLTPFLA